MTTNSWLTALPWPLFKNYAEWEYKCNFRVAGRSACRLAAFAGRSGLPFIPP